MQALLYCSSCVTYDRPKLYQPHYLPGRHTDLRFDGYYSINSSAHSDSGLFRGVFFFPDGSVMYSGLYKDAVSFNTQITQQSVWGIWGNYRIMGDTIAIETFLPNGGTWNHDRVLERGIIERDRITMFERMDRKEKVEKFKQTLLFTAAKDRPAAAWNWTRKKKSFNR